MSKRTWQTPNPLPLLHRQEPIRERLACWRKIPVPGPITQQKNGSIDFKTGHLSHFMIWSIDLVVRLKAEPPFKSP